MRKDDGSLIISGTLPENVNAAPKTKKYEMNAAAPLNVTEFYEWYTVHPVANFVNCVTDD